MGGGGGWGATPLYGLYRYVWPQRVWFSAVLVITRMWFLCSSLKLGMFLRRNYFFIIIQKEMNKGPSQIVFPVTLV